MSDMPSRIEVENNAPIAVDSMGDAYLDFTRQKEVLIHSETLSAQHPVVEIDLERILTTEDDGCGISIVFQDFGLPPRTINISGDFTSEREVAGMAREDEHYSGAPKKLRFHTMIPGLDDHKTYSLDDKGWPCDWQRIELKRGESMLWVHDGLPSDERTGYISSSWANWELVAVLPNDYYGPSDFSELEGYWRNNVPFIGISYEGKMLKIHSLDDVHAEVQYLQARSLADKLPNIDYSTVVEEEDANQLIEGLVAGNEEVKARLTSILEERRQANLTVAEREQRLTDAVHGNDSLETILAGVKRSLHEARSEAARLEREMKAFKQKTQSEPNTQSNEEFAKRLFGDSSATEADPHGHFAVIGINPEFLLALDVEAASRVVKGVHRGLAMQFHSDRNGTDDEPLKRVNIAVDSIMQRLVDGHWGRQ